MERKRFANHAGLMGVVFCLISVFLIFSGAVAAEKRPIRIGFLAPTTGNLAQLGMDMNAGVGLYLESVNYTIGGRKVEVVYEDEGAGPDQAVTKVKKLIKLDKVDMVAGVLMTSAAYAVAPVCIEEKIPLLITVSGGDDLTQRKSSKWVNRLGVTGCDIGYVSADYAYKKLGWRKAAGLGLDYGFGYEFIGAFLRLFESLGGKLISRQFAPITTLDFGPYIAKIPREADGIVQAVTGAASIRFLTSLRQIGLLDKMQVITLGSAVDESFLDRLGDTALGVYSTLDYSTTWQNLENQSFRELCQKKLKKEANLAIATSWTGFGWITKAVESINGKVEDKEALTKALRETELKSSIRGPLKVDKYGHALQTYFIRKVEKVGNQYQNTTLDSYPNVSQFWTFDPEEILKEPAYSRDYPSCKNCQ